MEETISSMMRAHEAVTIDQLKILFLIGHIGIGTVKNIINMGC